MAGPVVDPALQAVLGPAPRRAVAVWAGSVPPALMAKSSARAAGLAWAAGPRRADARVPVI
eukprot:7841749-Lingulodinium_polyedra.AAC.1